MKLRSYLLFVFLAVFPQGILALADSVRVSLLIISPGSEVYSALGHAALRLSSPSVGLDYCFTYGMDMRPGNRLKFITGHAPAGYLVAPARDYIEEYAREGRSVTEYELNLTLDERRQMWKFLDGQVARGLCDRYDYLHNGCAQVSLRSINAALWKTQLRFHLAADDPLQTATCRDRARYGFAHTDWHNDAPCRASFADFFWFLFVGTEADEQVSLERRIVLPNDLQRLLKNAEFIDSMGVSRPVLTGDAKELVAASATNVAAHEPDYLSAFCALLIALAVVVAVMEMMHRPCVRFTIALDSVLVAMYAFVAALELYLVCCSDLVATSWNNLLFAYNPLPLVVWGYYRYRRQRVEGLWLLLGAAVLTVVMARCQFPLAHNLFLTACVLRLITNRYQQ
jgi:hypothetical protein